MSLPVGDTVGGFAAPAGLAERADSLTHAAGMRFGQVRGIADSLASLLRADSLPAAADTVSAADVYGPASFAPPADATPACIASITSGAGYQLLTLLLLLLYLLLVFRYGGHAVRMMRAVWGKGGDKRHPGEGDMPGAEARSVTAACGLLLFGLALVKAGTLWGGFREVGLLSGPGDWLAVPAVMLALLAAMGFQAAVLNAAGRLTFSREFVRTLCAKRVALFASMTVTGTPFVLAAALSEGLRADVALLLFAAVIALHIVLYVLKSFFLFAEQKVSILFWILYLCAVEAMPVGILVIGLSKSWPV